MSSFLEDLLPWLVALYVLDGFVRVWPAELLLHSTGGRSFRLALPGFRFVLPLPSSEAFAVSAGVVLLGKESVAVSKIPARVASLFPSGLEEERLDGPEPFRSDERTIRLGRKTIAVAGSVETARRLAGKLEELRTASGAARARLRSRWLDEAFDLSDARQRLERYRESTASARAGGWVLSAVLLAALPSSLLSPVGRVLTPATCLVLAAGAWAWSMRPVPRLLRETGLGRPERVLAFLHFVFLPVSAARAPAVAARHLFERYDALTMAAALLDEVTFASWARRELTRLERLPADCPAALREAAADRSDRVRRLVREVLARDDVPPPPRWDASTSAFCPMCEAEYRKGPVECVDCGVPLEAVGTP